MFSIDLKRARIFSIFFLSFLAFSRCQGPISCSYRNSLIGYECAITIYNEEGYDGFASIPGPHNSGKSHNDVISVVGITRSTRNIPKIICYQFGYLEHMTFTSFGIVEVSPDSIRSCYFLKVLNLAHNWIEFIDPSTFGNFRTITELNLESNRLQVLGENHFVDLRSLRSLNLQNNPTIQMSPLLFRRLDLLEIINLSNCSVTQWPQLWFNNLQRLQHVYMNDNKMTSIPNGAFNSLSSIRELSISFNNLDNINRDSFGNLNQFQTISARYNEIRTLDRRIFDESVALYNANFAKNYCTDVDISDFSGNRNGNLAKLSSCFEGFEEGPWCEWNLQV